MAMLKKSVLNTRLHSANNNEFLFSGSLSMNYKISVIIPIFNMEKYLEETLDSLLHQTIGFENLEIIMVDDCSTDYTGAIIDRYAQKYENFVAIHLEENSGLPGKPRNTGIEKSSGEYIMFMDHDDYYFPEALEKLYNKITKEKADVIFGRYLKVFSDGKTIESYNYLDEVEELYIKTIAEHKRLLGINPSIWTKMFKRNFIIDHNIRFPEGILSEDLSFMVHSYLKANGIVYLNEFVYGYRIRNTSKDKSTIHIRNKKYLMAMIDGYYDTYHILKHLNKEEYFSKIFEGHLQYWILGHFTLSDTTRSEKKELLEKIAFLFDKLDKNEIKPKKNYLPLLNNILSRKFDEIMFDYIKRENELEKQLILKRKQIAELQTIRGYLNYKRKNLIYRLKRKLKLI
jgi:glycosyltransferase involved in cell wall biosynthesis